MHLQRLKDKLGNRSNASAEVEYDERAGVAGRRAGPRRGHDHRDGQLDQARLHSRQRRRHQAGLSCEAIASRQRTGRRSARTLAGQPAMAAVLADLALESEAATTLAIRLAGAADRAARGDAAEAALLRLMLPAAKHWICKRTPAVIAEALECLGGNGFVEESVLPRLYRDAPLNSIWEGSGNVTALDLLRALARSPGSVEAFRAELGLAAGADRRLDQAAERLCARTGRRRAADPAGAQYQARRLAGLLTVMMQAALLARHAPAAVSEAFCATRLADQADSAGPESRSACCHVGSITLPCSTGRGRPDQDRVG